MIAQPFFVLDMVRNSKDRLYCDVAQIMANHSVTYFKNRYHIKRHRVVTYIDIFMTECHKFIYELDICFSV